MRRGVFVTGTDTGVGKTVAACALIHALAAKGVAVHPFKPIAAGATQHQGRWVNEDTLALIEAEASSRVVAKRRQHKTTVSDPGSAPARASDFDFARVTPVLLREPMAPHIAAAREGRTLALDPILAAFDDIKSSFVVAEGVGGFMVPLAEHIDTVDLCRSLGLPVVMVVGMRLGCLNHALLTAHAITESGLPFAGWIANSVVPDMLAPDENLATLEARLGAPLLGRLPHRAPPDARAFALNLDVVPLL